ncbi:hypothetical protein A6R68_04997 [Neotoma lepida]|uniref:Uncharacterized protein n=1 Tax=Neotoma lepida TaxID=56216 RepID=A0A1A6GM93_NEOLE|nr:hypothetical protein A6R68_04997 [Neotoma lepida]
MTRWKSQMLGLEASLSSRPHPAACVAGLFCSSTHQEDPCQSTTPQCSGFLGLSGVQREGTGLTALTRAFILAKDKQINIYSDSKYANSSIHSNPLIRRPGILNPGPVPLTTWRDRKLIPTPYNEQNWTYNTDTELPSVPEQPKGTDPNAYFVPSFPNDFQNDLHLKAGPVTNWDAPSDVLEDLCLQVLPGAVPSSGLLSVMTPIHDWGCRKKLLVIFYLIIVSLAKSTSPYLLNYHPTPEDFQPLRVLEPDDPEETIDGLEESRYL